MRWLGMRRDVQQLLNAADGFVMSSAWEGIPLAIAEAMAMEKPVVATNVGGVSELVGSFGHLVPAQDSVLLAKAMLRVMRISPEARTEIGGACRRRIAAEFNMDMRVEEWEKLYADVLAAR